MPHSPAFAAPGGGAAGARLQLRRPSAVSPIGRRRLEQAKRTHLGGDVGVCHCVALQLQGQWRAHLHRTSLWPHYLPLTCAALLNCCCRLAVFGTVLVGWALRLCFLLARQLRSRNPKGATCPKRGATSSRPAAGAGVGVQPGAAGAPLAPAAVCRHHARTHQPRGRCAHAWLCLAAAVRGMGVLCSCGGGCTPWAVWYVSLLAVQVLL